MKGYTYPELLENNLNPADYDMCVECLLYYPNCEIVEVEDENGTALNYCPNCL